MSCPEAIGVRSTSIGAPAAIVEASGFIWETNGQSVATPPTAAAHPVATKRKSRRVGCSAEDAVVTITNPFQLQPAEPPQATHIRTKGGCRRRVPRGGRKTAFPSQSGGTSSPESFYWHPCRKSASPVSAARRATH